MLKKLYCYNENIDSIDNIIGYNLSVPQVRNNIYEKTTRDINKKTEKIIDIFQKNKSKMLSGLSFLGISSFTISTLTPITNPLLQLYNSANLIGFSASFLATMEIVVPIVLFIPVIINTITSDFFNLSNILGERWIGITNKIVGKIFNDVKTVDKNTINRNEKKHETALLAITVQIAIRNEPFEMVRDRVIQSSLSCNYPSEKLEIMIIDNSEKGKYEKLEEYCREKNIVFIHRDGTEGKKARNLNIGLGIAAYDENKYIKPKGEYTFIVDSDIKYDAELIFKLVKVLEDNPQAPFVTTNIIEKSRDNFFNLVMSGNLYFRQHVLDSIKEMFPTNFRGFGNMYRTELLRSIGGWAEDTVSEDTKTGLQLRINNHDFGNGIYASDLYVEDVIPSDNERYKKQQKRWAMGAAEIMKSKTVSDLLRSKYISFSDKYGMVSGLFSFFSISLFTCVIPTIITMIGLVSYFTGYGALLNIVMPNIKFFDAISGILFIYFSKDFFMLDFKKAFRTLLFIPSIIFIPAQGLAITEGIFEGLFKSQNSFVITPKNTTKKNILSKINDLTKDNYREFILGSIFILSSVLVFPAQLSFIGFIGFSYLVTPIVGLINIKRNNVLENVND